MGLSAGRASSQNLSLTRSEFRNWTVCMEASVLPVLLNVTCPPEGDEGSPEGYPLSLCLGCGLSKQAQLSPWPCPCCALCLLCSPLCAGPLLSAPNTQVLLCLGSLPRPPCLCGLLLLPVLLTLLSTPTVCTHLSTRSLQVLESKEHFVSCVTVEAVVGPSLVIVGPLTRASVCVHLACVPSAPIYGGGEGRYRMNQTCCLPWPWVGGRLLLVEAVVNRESVAWEENKGSEQLMGISEASQQPHCCWKQHWKQNWMRLSLFLFGAILSPGSIGNRGPTYTVSVAGAASSQPGLGARS